MGEKFRFLKTRGDQFLDVALHDMECKNLELCAFHLEQCCQLFLKYTLGLLLGDFPHVHNLAQLMDSVAKASGNKEFVAFFSEHKKLIESIGKAYFDARYYDTPFDKTEVDEMIVFTQNLKSKLETLWI